MLLFLLLLGSRDATEDQEAVDGDVEVVPSGRTVTGGGGIARRGVWEMDMG